MSSVRMCDCCGDIFSELSEDWSSDSRTIMRTDDSGRRKPVTMNIDQCATCVGGARPVRPRLAVEAAVKSAEVVAGVVMAPAGKLEQEIKAAELDDKDATIALLKLQLEDAQDKLAEHGIKPHTVTAPGVDMTTATATRMPGPVTHWTAGTDGQATS